jgi:hypothetical protein
MWFRRAGCDRVSRAGRAATRYEKTAGSFLGVLCTAATIDWLKVIKA